MNKEIVRFSSRFVVLFLIAVLLISTTGIGLNLSAPVMAAKNPVTCTDTPIKEATASASDANFPALAVLDQNPETLWSTYGKGSWIQFDLGKAKTLCNIDISWYKGDQRNNNFAISISNDGTSYKTLFNSKSTGTTAKFERYDLQNVVARYIKITVNGNTQNNYASIVDIRVHTNEDNSSDPAKNKVAPLSEDCVKTKVSKVTASGNKKPYVPNNAIDNNANTRWVNEKKDSWIKLDLGKTQTICEVGVQWNKGDSRVYSFTVSVSKDNKKFTDIAKLKSSGKKNGLESYSLKEVGARYIRITVTKNTENNFASIAEIALGSKKSPNPSPPPPSSDKCESNLPVSDVKSSGSQSGNPESGATDNDPNSRWSNQGFGSWIQIDLGGVKKICSADISWYRGNERQYTFDISSSQNGNAFTKIFSGINAVTNAPEKYTFSQTQARYVKITVTGNTQNDWASISELDIFGSPDSPIPTPTTPTPTTHLVP